MSPPALISMIKQLIAAPSVSSVSPQWDQGNTPVIRLLDGWLRALGFEVYVQPIIGHPDKYNLIASMGMGENGLVLSGHTDTVPCNPELWQSDPFQLRQADDRLYGLGTADMKSFFALVIEAIRDLPLNSLRQPLTIIATADEESSMCGARALKDLGRQLGRQVVIGEPTGLRPIRSHKGIGMERIRLHGQSGHSSDPSLGKSALEGMQRLMGELLRWRDQWQQRWHNPLFAVPVPTLNLGHIHGGDNPNRICGDCELHIDIRPLPGMALDGVRGELQQHLMWVMRDTGLGLEMTPLFEGIAPMETPNEAAIVRAVEEMTGHQSGAVAYATEGPFYVDLGLDALIFGPGSIDQAHQPNEYLALDQIGPGVCWLRQLVSHFCL